MPSTDKVHKEILTQPRAQTQPCTIKIDPCTGKQVVVPFLMGHLGWRKIGWARGLSRLGCPSSPCDGAERETDKQRVREREHGSDRDSGICVGGHKSQPPILDGGMLTTYLGSLSRTVLKSREGAQAVSLRIKHSPGQTSDLAASDTPASVAVIQPGWSKSKTSGEAGTGGVHWAGLGVMGNTRWAAQSFAVPS